ncbi:MAG: hypothetical protein SF069_18835 [Phycisphaerae bacterium]|nr:hypothetical protein [Phycisphaerae bacterium]
MRSLRLNVEINTREQFRVFRFRPQRFNVEILWIVSRSEVTRYKLDELRRTQLRQLYQRLAVAGRPMARNWLIFKQGKDIERPAAESAPRIASDS